MTRYPKSGKGKKWTLLELKAIPDAWSATPSTTATVWLACYIRVASNSNITIRFKFAFRWLDKLVWYQCGTWPQSTKTSAQIEKVHVNCSDLGYRTTARAAWFPKVRQKSKLSSPREPSKKHKTRLFRKCSPHGSLDGVRRKDGNAEIKRAFKKDVLPAIGTKPVKQITEHDLRTLLRAMVKFAV